MITWNKIIEQEQQQAYLQNIYTVLTEQKQQQKIIYPLENEIFNAFKLTEFNAVKVVILGQDPYHGENQAHGLAFSVNHSVKVPPSLVNIYKELVDDIDGFTQPQSGCLVKWAEQGVLLLNTVLTVEKGKAHSHAKLGWEIFTDQIIASLNQNRENLVFMLWGSHAQQKGQFIDRTKHLVLTAPHPSPLSAYKGFLGCRHFSKTNTYLTQHNQTAIDWQI